MTHVNGSINEEETKKGLRQRVRNLLHTSLKSRIPKALCDVARLASVSVNAAFLNLGLVF